MLLCIIRTPLLEVKSAEKTADYTRGKTVLFADDTNVFLSGKDMNPLIDTLQLEFKKLYDWLLANKLTLNIAKTHFMIFHRARKKQHMINIKINKVQIEQTKHTKFLGIIFDDNLCWSNHISYINRKIAKGIGIICRAKKVL